MDEEYKKLLIENFYEYFDQCIEYVIGINKLYIK